MKDIDFLPLVYREATLKRKNMKLRLAVVVLFAMMIGGAAIYQQWLRREATRELAALELPYLEAMAKRAKLANLKSRVEQMEKVAELWAYLRHPWPRSQIVARLTGPLPESVLLDQIEIGREPIVQTFVSESATGKPSPAAEAKPLTAADRDLAKIRQEYDTKNVTVILTGHTDNHAALHDYLEQLGKESLFAKVELQSIEKLSAEATGKLRFSAKATVVPGYLQPGGPGLVETADTKR